MLSDTSSLKLMILRDRLTYAFKQVSQSVVKAGGIPCGQLARRPRESTRQRQESSQSKKRLGVGGALFPPYPSEKLTTL